MDQVALEMKHYTIFELEEVSVQHQKKFKQSSQKRLKKHNYNCLFFGLF